MVRFEHLKIEAGLTIFLKKKCDESKKIPPFQGVFFNIYLQPDSSWRDSVLLIVHDESHHAPVLAALSPVLWWGAFACFR